MVTEATIDAACEDIARKILTLMDVKKTAAEIHEKMKRVQVHAKREDDPMKLSPMEEATKLLREYHAEKLAKANDPIAEIRKANADPVLSSNHYAELMKRYAAHNAAEIAKVRQPRVELAQPDGDDDGPVDWSDDKAATRAYRKEQAAKASGANGPPNAQDRFSTRTETGINDGKPRQVTGANVNR
jgi:hypothetical protein